MAQLKSVGLGFLGAVLAIAAWIAIDTTGVVRRPSFSVRVGKSDSEFERRVRDYLMENPKVLLEALQQLENRERVVETDEMGRVIAARSDDIFNDPDTPIGGNPQGDVNLVEFFDYNCPYCRRVAPTLVEIERSDPKLRIVYKEWPILGPNSEFAARAALASRKQGKYDEFHRAMMLASGLMNESQVLEVAATVGLDVELLKKDMQAPELAAAIERNRALAQALRITGTPTFVIGDEMLRGAADAQAIRALISEARARNKGAPEKRTTLRQSE